MGDGPYVHGSQNETSAPLCLRRLWRLVLFGYLREEADQMARTGNTLKPLVHGKGCRLVLDDAPHCACQMSLNSECSNAKLEKT